MGGPGTQEDRVADMLRRESGDSLGAQNRGVFEPRQHLLRS